MLLKNQVIDPFFPECPVRNVISRISGKWPFLILLTLESRPDAMRYKDIRKAIPDISEKMLTITLQDLEADGLIVRTAYAEVPPRVEYSLSERSKSLMPHINGLVDWAIVNINDIISDRKKYYG